MKRFVVPGANGQMGRLICKFSEGEAFAHSRAVGDLDAALKNVAIRDDAVLIDFTVPEAAARHAALAAERGYGLVVGTTNLDDRARAAIDRAAERVPVLVSSNTSLGANLLMKLSNLASTALPDADCEIVELHHRKKRDAPSGTAKSLLEAVASARHTSADEVAQTERAGDAPRQRGEVGVFGVRGGTVPGEHTVYFFLDDERIELTHRVTDRAIFARGAISAARWLRGKAPGQYAMQDVLG